MSGGLPRDNGIIVAHVDFVDNQACLDVTEKVCRGVSLGLPGDDGIVVTHVDFIDNQACLDVIEKVCRGGLWSGRWNFSDTR